MANVIYDVVITSNPVFEVIVNNGASGKQGNKGDKGDVGVGIASGGVVGQYLTKKSSTDYDTEFKTIDSTEVAYGDGNVSEGLDNRYTKSATDLLLDDKSGITHLHTGVYSPIAHIHDDRYYTETELNNGQLDNRYYTETETNDLLDDKMNLDGSNSDVITLTYSNGTTLTIDPDRLIANFTFPDGTTANVPSELWYAEGKSLEVITEGDNIMFAGSQGDHYLVKKAVASELAANPHLYAGVSTKTTPINGWVKITRWGLVNNINTNGWAYGTRLYFNPSTLGFTDVLPSLPLARIYVGMVVRTGIATGIILVDPEDKSLYTNSELDTLFLGKVDKVTGKSLVSDTLITDLSDGGDTVAHTHKSIVNEVSVDNAKVEALATGVKITRNVADANHTLLVNQHTSASGKIQKWQAGGVDRADVGFDGTIYSSATFTTVYGLKNYSGGANNAYVNVADLGTKISRNIADANPALIVNQANASSTGKILDLQFGGVSKASILANGNINGLHAYLAGIASMNNALYSRIYLNDTGTLIQRDVADTNPCLKVNQINASSTGLITDFQFGGVSKFSIDKNGQVAQEAWITPTLLNGWTVFTTISDLVGYYKDSLGRIHLTGAVNGGTAVILFVLPSAYRPSKRVDFAIASNDGTTRAYIEPNGNVTLTATKTWITLNGISFRV